MTALTSETVRLIQRNDDPLAAALLEIAKHLHTIELLDASHANLHALYQRTLHRAELAESKLTSEVIAAQSSWGLEVWCDGKCGCPPLRIKVAPPEDAVALWVRGHGWKTTESGHWCPGCAR